MVRCSGPVSCLFSSLPVEPAVEFRSNILNYLDPHDVVCYALNISLSQPLLPPAAWRVPTSLDGSSVGDSCLQ
jgi:hypothetical protein